MTSFHVHLLAHCFLYPCIGFKYLVAFHMLDPHPRELHCTFQCSAHTLPSRSSCCPPRNRTISITGARNKKAYWVLLGFTSIPCTTVCIGSQCVSESWSNVTMNWTAVYIANSHDTLRYLDWMSRKGGFKFFTRLSETGYNHGE